MDLDGPRILNPRAIPRAYRAQNNSGYQRYPEACQR